MPGVRLPLLWASRRFAAVESLARCSAVNSRPGRHCGIACNLSRAAWHFELRFWAIERLARCSSVNMQLTRRGAKGSRTLSIRELHFLQRYRGGVISIGAVPVNEVCRCFDCNLDVAH